jgi:hypothetical protein
MPPVTEYPEEIPSELPAGHVYTDHVHPWEEIVHYVCKLISVHTITNKLLTHIT